MYDHDQRFKTLLKTFLPEFFALFFADRAETFDLSRAKALMSAAKGCSDRYWQCFYNS